MDNGVYNEFVNEQEREEGMMLAANNSMEDNKMADDAEEDDEIYDDMEVDIEEFNGNVSSASLARPSKHKKEIDKLNKIDVGFDSCSRS